MASPAVTQTARPLDGLHFTASGPAALTGPVAEHLRLLGAAAGTGPAAREGDRAGRITLGGSGSGIGSGSGSGGGSGSGFGGSATATAAIAWSAAPDGSADTLSGRAVTDEATAQAATGIMAVHGRRDGEPRGLAVDYALGAAAVLTTQGLLAGLLAQARGGSSAGVDTYVDRAGLLVVSQYLAATGADEGEAAELAAGGPPFTAADGTLFELETLDPGAWAGFWRALDAPADAIRAGWRPFQFRYATACAPFPDALHATTRAHGWQRIRDAAAASGAEVCRLRSLTERAAEHDGAAPWTLAPYDSGGGLPHAVPAAVPHAVPAAPRPAKPLAGLTVLEAGRRIQAPLAAHLLGLLGADVVRIEPPGGDPLRGMPPACSGVSARWLALNRGKRAVEMDIKSPADRLRLRDLAADADVFLHNWAPGKAAELGLDHDDLAAANPALVYAYTGGWGTGRITDAPMGTDFMVQARTGVGEAARSEGEVPAPSLMTLLDVLGGLLGAEAVLAGLLLRERTGRGVRVDSSLLGAADVLTLPALRRARRGENPRRPAGFRTPLRTADGWIAPADADAGACAAAAAAHGLAGLPTEDALRALRGRGLHATAVTTDLADLHHDPRFGGSISRDAHGAPAVPDPWSFR
ncbi:MULTISPECIES: CoA transferase [unclassified Streptomyces]|uniref:CoA transferase n=1 Tax=unclassified Streptomyces TaxID=2593676 RepID=UPI000DC7DC6F|nr:MULTISPECIES: CoA transferase [unclassified Streptomyces]AWZ04326.1 CoA transferase [Streptomyces sp. ICC4]AWZ11963.1 CoA transferase [Streptomyces sp. ICC1]